LKIGNIFPEVGKTCYIVILQEQEMEKQKLLFHQARLANRGVAEMVLLHISACKGVPSDMVMKTLQLGIAVLRGGNVDIQMVNFCIADNHQY
jgi:hypothetical protein